MKLQILVPHYKETADVITPLLDSIAVQQNVDFDEVGVIICHDGNESKDFVFRGLNHLDGLDLDAPYLIPDRYPFEI